MFHRVKSETEEQDAQVQTNEASAKAAPVQKETSSVQQSLLKEEKQDAAAPAKADAKPQNVYQRVGSSAVRPGVQYSSKPATPSYKAATPSAPKTSLPSAPKSTSTDVDAGDRKLTIGRGITMSGEIDSCDHLHVEGTVEAALRGATELNIAESGVFYGTVEIENATIAGRFEGEIVVSGRLLVESTGVIAGSISYRELEVESGAVIDGRITPLPANSATQSAHVPEDAAADNTDELFTEAAE